MNLLWLFRFPMIGTADEVVHGVAPHDSRPS